MVFKLLMPYLSKNVEKGFIITWYKTSGEWVSYGDTIFYIRIDEVVALKRLLAPRDIRASTDSFETLSERRKYSFYFRISSADMGFMRCIYAKESAYREVGALLAVLTSDVNEEIDEFNLTQASTFRVTANMIE